MFNIFNKQKISTPLFMISSVVALAILFGLYLVIKINLSYNQNKSTNHAKVVDDTNVDKDGGDPFITRNPDARPIIDSPTISPLDPIMGDPKAPVAIVEFSDYECTFCQQQEQILKRVLEKYKGKVRLVWKDYPDKNYESASFRAAIAARCADEQNKFWPFHDFLFEQNKNLTNENFGNIAKLLEMDVDKFAECIADPKMRKVVEENMTEANDLNITGVPFFYVNKQEIMGEINQEKLERIVEVELGRSKK